MANTRSDLMANVLATPTVLNRIQASGGRSRTKRALATVAGTESANHIFPLCRLKATDRILDLKIAATDLGTTVDADFGLHQAGDWTAADQTVVDQDCLADAVVLSSAADTVWRSIYGSGAGAVDPPNTGLSLWQVGGVSAQPAAGTEYDVTMTLTTVTGIAAGSVVVLVEYTSGD